VGLAVPRRVGNETIWLLGLAKRIAHRRQIVNAMFDRLHARGTGLIIGPNDDDYLWQFDEPVIHRAAYVTKVSTPADERSVEAVIDGLVAWYEREMRGTKGGRKFGLELSEAEFREDYEEAAMSCERDNVRPTFQTMSDRMPISESTLRKYCRLYDVRKPEELRKKATRK
jgi:hypothetical protein